MQNISGVWYSERLLKSNHVYGMKQGLSKEALDDVLSFANDVLRDTDKACSTSFV